MAGSRQESPVIAPPIARSKLRTRTTMDYFLCRFNPPRATFPQDISDEERQLMQRHARYWQALLGKRKVLLVGPVGDPAGEYRYGLLSA